MNQSGEALDKCTVAVPDAILISLSLPENGGFNLFQLLRSSAKTKNVPIFALCVKTAADDQARAQQMGFTGMVTKPIDTEDLKAKLARALNLDTSYRYFQVKSGVLLMTLPASFGPSVANEVSTHMRAKMAEAVDTGVDKVVFDLSALKTADISLIKLGLEFHQLCSELSLKQRMIGSAVVSTECKKYEETKDWSFVGSFEEAVAVLTGRELVPA
jgi:two-component system cell cycle response regulator